MVKTSLLIGALAALAPALAVPTKPQDLEGTNKDCPQKNPNVPGASASAPSQIGDQLFVTGQGSPIMTAWNYSPTQNTQATPQQDAATNPSSDNLNPTKVDLPDTGRTRTNTPSTDEDIAGTSEISRAVLEMHNNVRGQYGAAPLVWDQQIAQWARNNMTTMCGEHTGADNLWGSMTSLPDAEGVIGQAVNSWAIEADKYNFRNKGPQEGLLHFTAMVWRSSTKLGCAWSNECRKSGEGTSWDVVCKYDPVPNSGDYENNVGDRNSAIVKPEDVRGKN